MTEKSEETRKVVAKIEKILSLARNNPNENEAASAADKVQELLAEYNLTMNDLPNGKVVDIIHDHDFLTYFAGWIKPLFNSVAKLNFTGYFFESFPTEFIKEEGLDRHARKLYVGSNSRTYLRHNFIGREANVIVAKLMAEYLVSTMETLVREALKSVPVPEKASFKYSFMNACALRLSGKMMKRMEQTATKSTGNLPALLSMYQQAQSQSDDFVANELGLKTKKSNSMVRFNNAAGYREGFKAGDSINLDAQISGGDRNARRITQK